MPHCWPACGCRAELEHYYPEAPTPTPDVLNTLFFKHAVSLGRSGACHKSKNHHHYLEAIQLAREAAFAHQSTLQKKQKKTCKLSLCFWTGIANCVWETDGDCPEHSFRLFHSSLKLSGKSLPPDLLEKIKKFHLTWVISWHEDPLLSCSTKSVCATLLQTASFPPNRKPAPGTGGNPNKATFGKPTSQL